MKLYINKGQYGWYTTAKNRNDKEDKAYVNLFFPKNTSPLSCYKGKVGMVIYKYGMFDSNKDVKIEPNDLPFF